MQNFLIIIITLSASFANAYEGENYKLVRFVNAKDKKTVVNTLSTYGFRIIESLDQIDLHVVVPENKKTANEKGLKADSKILYVENNNQIKANVIPNDVHYNKLLGMNLIKAPAAWDTTTGSREIVVAVSDTGIDLDHSDLAANMWKNAGEIPGNGIDDDQNGFVDDVHGYNFVSDNGNPDDDNMHGTHCAGTIGAVGNNSRGVAGVNWNVKLMAVKFLSGSGSGSDLGGIKTILYAVDNGARVINASWGGGAASQAFEDALNYAAENDVLFVAAAGNDSDDTDAKPHHPSAYHYLPSMISVASSTTSGEVSSFSNYGKTSTLVAAPGSDIYSTVHNNAYKSLSGTSMATPHVAGLAALILSVQPNISVITLRNAILNAIQRSSNWTNKVATGGWIDAELALAQFNNGPQVWPQQIRLKKGLTHNFTPYGIAGAVTWNVSDTTIATIDQNGLLQANNPGVIQVSATTAQGSWQSGNIEVIAPAPPAGCGRNTGSNKNLAGVGLTESGLLALPLFLIGLIRIRLSRRAALDPFSN